MNTKPPQNLPRILVGFIILLTLALPSVDASESVEPPSGLVSWWPGDGHAFDIVGENNGKLENGATFAPGIVGQAFSFDGEDDRVSFSALEIGQLQQLTIDLWVKMNNLRPFGIQRFVTLEDEKAVLRSDHGQLHFYMRIDGEMRHVWVENVLQAGVFHHVAGTYDGQVMRLYLDGVQVGSLKIGGVVAYAGSGHFSNPGGETLDGFLDEVEIYNRALSLSEIQIIFKAGSSGKSKLATITGIVTDADTGNPISGATVIIDGDQATTDSDGFFSFSLDAMSYNLTVSKQGYQTKTTQVKVDPGGTQKVLVTLSESKATITGRVTEARTGNAVSGATVTADGGQATTNYAGSFSLSVKAGTYTLTVSKQGYQTSTLLMVTVGPGETQSVLVSLSESMATLSGRVTDAESGEPVSGATVTTDGEQTTTDSGGSFSLSVAVGGYTLIVRKGGYDTCTLQGNVGPGETKEVHATLSESRSIITGMVTDAKTGNPISGATVKVDSEQATTDSGGSFSLSVKAGTYTLTVTQKGYKTSTNPITLSPGDTKNVPMIMSAIGLPIVPIIAGVGGIVVVAIVAYLKTRKPVERVPKPYALGITAEPTKLPADGRSTSNIIVELINEEGTPIKANKDVKVILSTSMGSITSPLTISKGETTVNAALRSSLETGNVKVLVESKGLKGANVSLVFTERKRYCMHCGAQMLITDLVCPNCHQIPPSGVDVKQCPNCGEIMPSIARFCGRCGARQHT